MHTLLIQLSKTNVIASSSVLLSHHFVYMYSEVKIFVKACATSTDASTVELARLARSLRVILPAVEILLSDAASDARMTSDVIPGD